MLAYIQEPKVKSYAPCRQPISERIANTGYLLVDCLHFVSEESKFGSKQ